MLEFLLLDLAGVVLSVRTSADCFFASHNAAGDRVARSIFEKYRKGRLS